jgi:hypothetical protein
MTNPDLIELAMRMAQSGAPMSVVAPEGSAPEQPDQVQPPPLPEATPKPGLVRAAEAKGTKTSQPAEITHCFFGQALRPV